VYYVSAALDGISGGKFEGPMELLGKSMEELREYCVALGEPAFRGAQIYHALYSERRFDVAQITNLPLALRERLRKQARITLPEVKQRFASADGSVRYLFGLGSAEEREKLNTEDRESTPTGSGQARYAEKKREGKRRPTAKACFGGKRCSCRATGGRRFVFPRRQGARWIATSA